MAGALAASEPWFEPGTRHTYHTNTYGHLVGEIVHRVGGRTCGDALASIAGPLDADVWFGVPPGHHPRCADIVWNGSTRVDVDFGALTGDELMTEILASQGRILVAQGSIPAGLASIAKALAMSRELRIAATPDCLETNQYAAEAYLLAGQPQAAIAIFEKNIAGLDIEARSPRWVTYLRLAGWAYLDAGQPQKAVVTLQRALDLSAGHPFYPGWVARLRYQLARALLQTGGDPVRARTLADEAHDELVAEPVKQPLLEEVDAWRVKSFLLH